MSQVVEIETNFMVADGLVPQIQNCLKKSSHSNPIAGIGLFGHSQKFVFGLRTRSVWAWRFQPHDKEILKSNVFRKILKWEKAGVTFYCVTGPEDWAREHLDRIRLANVDDELKCLWNDTGETAYCEPFDEYA